MYTKCMRPNRKVRVGGLARSLGDGGNFRTLDGLPDDAGEVIVGRICDLHRERSNSEKNIDEEIRNILMGIISSIIEIQTRTAEFIKDMNPYYVQKMYESQIELKNLFLADKFKDNRYSNLQQLIDIDTPSSDKTIKNIDQYLSDRNIQRQNDIEVLHKHAERSFENDPVYSSKIYKKLTELEPMSFDYHYKFYVLQRRFGEIETANYLLNKMYDLSVFKKDPEKLAMTFQCYGVFMKGMQKFDMSNKFFHLALDLFKKMEEPLGVIRQYANIGEVYINILQYEQNHNEKIDIIKKSKYYKLGKVYKRLAKFSFWYYGEKAREKGDIELHKSVIRSYAAEIGNLGRLCAIVGDFEQARKWFEQEGDQLALGEKGAHYARNLGNRASLEFDCHNYEKALRYCEDAININENLERIEGIANQYFLKAKILYYMGSTEQVLINLLHSRKLYMKMRSYSQVALIDQFIHDIKSSA